MALTLAAAPGAPAAAQLPEAARRFDEGNRHYGAGAYQDALHAYEQALAAGYASGALYYNMGNAYFRLDELGQAIRYYEKARRLMPDDPLLRHNLEITRSRIEAPFSTLPTPLWVTWWRRYVVRLGAWPFFVAGLLGYGLAAALVGYRIWTGTRNAWHRRALSASLLLGLLLLAIAFAAALDRTSGRQAVVVAGRAALHETPTDEAPATLDVPEGIVLDVLHRQDAWMEVRLPNGVTGWIRTAAAAEV